MAPTTYYRNLVEIKNILPGALWLQQGKLLVLVDDDQYVTAPLAAAQEHFQVAPQP